MPETQKLSIIAPVFGELCAENVLCARVEVLYQLNVHLTTSESRVDIYYKICACVAAF